MLSTNCRSCTSVNLLKTYYGKKTILSPKILFTKLFCQRVDQIHTMVLLIIKVTIMERLIKNQQVTTNWHNLKNQSEIQEFVDKYKTNSSVFNNLNPNADQSNCGRTFYPESLKFDKNNKVSSNSCENG